MIAKIKATINKDHYQTNIEAGANAIIADEVESAGGAGQGFTPFELLASSLAACTCITLRMYIDRKEWTIDSVEVNVTIKKDEVHDETHFERIIKLNGTFTDEQKQKLMDIANLCPVHKTLSKAIYINTSI